MTAYGRQRVTGKVDSAALGYIPLPTATRALWIAEDCSSVGDGNAVSSWVDRINGYTVSNTSTARPLYRATGLGGRQASLQFDGTNDVLIYTASNPISTATSGTIVVVGDVPVPASGGATMWGSGDDASATRYMLGCIIAGNKLVAQMQNASTLDQYSGVTTVNTPMIYEWESIGTESQQAIWRMRSNNSLLTLANMNGSNLGKWFGTVAGRDRFGIGALPYNNTINNYLGGHIAMVLIIDAELSPSERISLYQWISAYYGIAAA